MEVVPFKRMDDPFKKNAVYADLYDIPDGWVGQIVDGNLYAFPRPRPIHARAIGSLYRQLVGSHGDDPDGWILLVEPEIRFGRNILVPDIAGWRTTRMSEIPEETTVTLAPDWVCEGLSPSTAWLDRGRKREICAKHGVDHIWFVDPATNTLEVLERDGKTYRLMQTASGSDKRRFPPFSMAIDLARLWLRKPVR